MCFILMLDLHLTSSLWVFGRSLTVRLSRFLLIHNQVVLVTIVLIRALL